MGRAIVRDPKVFLMDEPLSNLDAKLRVSTRSEISQLQRRLNTTMLYVTHDQTEAMTMADRIAVLEGGNMQQVGTPEELYQHPANAFVGAFIGTPSMNMVRGSIQGNDMVAGSLRLPLPALVEEPHSDAVIIGIRPENIELVGESEGDARGRVILVENYGSDKYVHIEIEGLEDAGHFMARTLNTNPVREGDTVNLRFERERIHLFDGETKERIVQ